MKFPNPLIPGFNPDPSVVAVGGAYYLVTSTFEYLPGLPVYRSTDLTDWTHIGNVASRPEQACVTGVPTGGGVWAPTIRYRDGVFYVIVTIAMSPRGCVVFTAADPAGPWSDGTTIDGVGGIDPDLAWDDDGTAYVTFSGRAVRPAPGHPAGPGRPGRGQGTGTAAVPVVGYRAQVP
jgi:xylan 1,4-beta-xylosidase